MKYVIDPIKKREDDVMISVIRMEIDYELVTLYDAMQADNKELIAKSKEKLTELQTRLVKLEEKQYLLQ